MDGRTDGCMNGCMDGRADGCMYGLMAGWLDGWMGGWTDGCIGRYISVSISLFVFLCVLERTRSRKFSSSSWKTVIIGGSRQHQQPSDAPIHPTLPRMSVVRSGLTLDPALWFIRPLRVVA